MPSNAKLARRAEKAKKSGAEESRQQNRDRASEMLVDKYVMPEAINLIKGEFSPHETASLLGEFNQKAYAYFKTQQDATDKRRFEVEITKTGIVLTDGKVVLCGAYLKTPTILYRDEQADLLSRIHADRQKSRKETFFFYHRGMETIMWGNNEELLREMKAWRNQKRDKTLTIYPANRCKFEIEGRTYYTLTLTQLDKDGKPEQIGIDKLGVGVKHLVDGLMYWFVSEANRDATYKYVMEIK
jgi:hypothetical protein